MSSDPAGERVAGHGGSERGRGALRGPVVASLAGKAAEAVTLLLLATVVPRVLGPADYGRFAVALAVVAIGAVAMTLGGATLLARYVPAAAAGGRGALARALSVRLARNRAVLFAVLTVIATALVTWDPARFPPLLTALVLIARALNVVATLALQADLGLGHAGAWCARYPLQNAVLVVAAIVLYDAAGATGAVAAIVVSAAVAFGLGVVAVTPLLRRRFPPVRYPRVRCASVCSRRPAVPWCRSGSAAGSSRWRCSQRPACRPVSPRWRSGLPAASTIPSRSRPRRFSRR